MKSLPRPSAAPRGSASGIPPILLSCSLLVMMSITGCAVHRPAAVRPQAALPVAPLPAAPAKSPLPSHTVRPGETLWSIGQRYGVAYQDIMRLNGMPDARVAAGQRLTLPPAPAPGVRTPSVAVPLFPTERWTHIVIHHSATASGNARIFDRAHRRRGFSRGLGYHFLVDNGTAGRRDGQIEVGPRWTRQEQGAHCNAGGMNGRGIGVCLVGNFTNRPISGAQMEALVELVDQLRTYYGIPLERVIRHRDVLGKNTACPGNKFPWSDFRRRLASRARTRRSLSAQAR